MDGAQPYATDRFTHEQAALEGRPTTRAKASQRRGRGIGDLAGNAERLQALASVPIDLAVILPAGKECQTRVRPRISQIAA